MNNVNQTFLEQSAYYQLKSYCGNIVPVSGCRFYSMIASTKDISQRFAIDVLADSETICYRKTKDLQDNLDDKQLELPIIACFVNEETYTIKIQQVLGWNYGERKVFAYDVRKAVPLSQSNIDVLFNMIDNTIRVLPYSMWHFCKELRLNDMQWPDASIVYMRVMSNNYKMINHPQMSELEKFHRNLSGIPEDDYPKDDLDAFIFDITKERFPKVSVRTTSFLFNVDMKDIQKYNSYYKKTIDLLFLENDLNYQAIKGGHILSKQLEFFSHSPEPWVDLIWETYNEPQYNRDMNDKFCKTYSPISRYLLNPKK